jgi:predicted hotdog family 3-hydroxylacyl-ACP dehydratase
MPGPNPAGMLPHEAPMVLVDEVVRADAAGAAAVLTVRTDDRFFRPGFGVPAHVAIEWMAQTCGLFAGQDMPPGRAVEIGFLLGTRRFQAAQPWFVEGERLTVQAELVLRDDGMGVFDCTVCDAEGRIRASAQLTTYQPPHGASGGGISENRA